MTNLSALQEQIELQYRLAEMASRASYLEYLSNVVIDSRPEPRRFGLIAEPWQWDIAKILGPALESVAGLRSDYNGPRSFWFTMGRGHDKTSSIGRGMNWVLGFARKHLSAAVGAESFDQASLIVEAMQNEARLNPWIESKVTHGRKTVRGPGGVMKILAADTTGNWGLNSDLVILDEITHWTKKDLFDILWSGREKRPGSVFIIISNAGLKGSWQEEIKESAKVDPSWFVHETPEGEHMASWMTPEAVQRMRLLLPRGLAKRVIDNKWIDPAEESDYLSRAEVEACAALGIELGLAYRTKGERGRRCVASIDYGPKRDRTVLSVGHKRDGIHRIDRMDVWQGSPDSPILLAKVEEWIDEINREFFHPVLVFDPYQMEGIAQKYEVSHEVHRFEARGGKANYKMAENLRSLIVSKRLAWYPGAGRLMVNGREDTFENELMGLVLKQTPYGYRFDHETKFHDDRAVSVGMMAVVLEEMDPSGPGTAPGAMPNKVAESDIGEFLSPSRFKAHRPPQGHMERRGLWGT